MASNSEVGIQTQAPSSSVIAFFFTLHRFDTCLQIVCFSVYMVIDLLFPKLFLLLEIQQLVNTWRVKASAKSLGGSGSLAWALKTTANDWKVEVDR